MRSLPAVDAARSGLFTHAEALAAGWTSAALRHHVSTGQLVRHRPGVYGPVTAEPDEAWRAARQRIRVGATAAVLANPCAVASHTASVVLRDLPVWFLPDRPCVTVQPHFVGDIEGAHLHRARTPDRHLTTIGVTTTVLERTVIDVGREHGALSALVLADAALHRDQTTVDELRVFLRDCRGWPGVRAGREAVEFADWRSESPLETASRFKLRGLVPPAELQASIFDLTGGFIGRTDFLWDEFGVVGEADGMDKYDIDHASLRDERVRHERLEQCGLTVVRWTAADLHPIDGLITRLRAAFARAHRLRPHRRWTAQLLYRASARALHLSAL
ncbi:MAG: type IV toxin-antitoxin system AbiEi family antitoxin domain-containing protein [Jatrophihabitans sp.]|uniref:type IV toxin-antitoxin system AbiEi family antitoxin domain-containing protein n=1 Tax=Jatrophihabitans sp. TaxID=1932789 RepID=UPI0039148ACC